MLKLDTSQVIPLPPHAVRKSWALAPEVVVMLPLVIVPLVPSITIGPNVCPASIDTLSTDSRNPVIGLVSRHDVYTLFSPAATISAFCDSVSVDYVKVSAGEIIMTFLVNL